MSKSFLALKQIVVRVQRNIKTTWIMNVFFNFFFFIECYLHVEYDLKLGFSVGFYEDISDLNWPYVLCKLLKYI